MDNSMKLDLDKLPIKRVEAIDESGLEHFPPEIGPEEKRIDQIRRIDFSWVIERDAKKAKSSKEPAASASAGPWPWQGLVENLQLAHQELSVIIDLINTVEANDAVTVAGMTRPKPLPSEVLSDLSVSAATKLQRLKHLGKYFKQSSKALEEQVAKETRFYGALIRLQHNWKVKRHRLASSGSSNDGFMIDLLSNSITDVTTFHRFTPMSIVRIDRDSSGTLSVHLPPKSCRFLRFGFVGIDPGSKPSYCVNKKLCTSKPQQDENKEVPTDGTISESVKAAQSILREIHQAIFEEQVFDLVIREALYASAGVNVIMMREDFLQLGVGQDASIFLSLDTSERDDSRHTYSSEDNVDNGEDNPGSLDIMMIDEQKTNIQSYFRGFANPSFFQIYLQHILYENVFAKAKERRSVHKTQIQIPPPTNEPGLISHFCLTISHRIFSNKVLSVLENLAGSIPYLQLLSHPTWHSRTSSWSFSIKVSNLTRLSGQHKHLDNPEEKAGIRQQFHTKVVVTDECITVIGEGAANVIGSFGGSTMNVRPPNSFGCDLADLPMILLQQAAGQVIRWLHEEALLVGVKATRDFLCLYFDLEEGNKIGLAAHVDPSGPFGCISWWLVMDDGSDEGDPQLHKKSSLESEDRKFLGNLLLEELYSIMMDLVNLCSNSSNLR